MDRTPRKPDSCGKGDSPFANAAALWHMGDLSDSAGKGQLTVHRDVKIGVELTGGDHETQNNGVDSILLWSTAGSHASPNRYCCKKDPRASEPG